MKRLAVAALVAAATSAVPTAQAPPPIIDMHLHANTATSQGPPPLAVCPGVPFPPGTTGAAWPDTFMAALKKPSCAQPIWSPMTDREIMDRTLAIMRRRNVYGVTSGARLDDWRSADPARVVPSMGLDLPSARTPDDMRAAFKAGRYRVLGEVGIQYQGIDPSDARFEPYLAVAEELDLPVSIHVGTGPPGAPYLGFANYRARLHSALLVEDALVRHPKLRVSLMHAGWPMVDDLLATMWAHPQLHVDVGAIDWVLPRAAFHDYLRRIVDVGFAKRIMFGSDQMLWPETIEAGIEAIESAPFLSAEQKRDIFYNNAARYLKLSDAEIARHHGR